MVASFSRICAGISPAAAWIAITGGLDLRMLILAPRLRCGWADSTCCTRAKILSTTEARDFFRAQEIRDRERALIARAMHIGVVALLLWLRLVLDYPGQRGRALPLSRHC